MVFVIPLLLDLDDSDLADGAQQPGKVGSEHPGKGLVEAIHGLELLFGEFLRGFEVVFLDLLLFFLDVFPAGGHLFEQRVNLAL